MKLHVEIRLPADLPPELRVSIDNKDGRAMTLKRGPEISSDRVYHDAVYLIVTNARCYIVLHARAS
jgi:hypothetical protein